MLNVEEKEERLTEEVLDAITKLLQRLARPNPLPLGLRPKLQHWMRIIRPQRDQVLELPNRLHKFAYYIVKGFIYVTYVDPVTKLVQVKCFYTNDEIAALRNFVDEVEGPYTLVAGCDTVLARISLEGMHDIYNTWPDMKDFAKKVVREFEGDKERLKNRLTQQDAKFSVPIFFHFYPCLEDGMRVRLRPEIADYLGISPRTLRRWQNK